jgi:enamine deaminase RidA (YjgF/YER057c/UK114 family)
VNPGFAIADAEINVIAVRGGAGIGRREIAGTSATACEGLPAAVRAGDLVFFSGMVAADSNGLVAAARTDPRQPYFGCSIEAQMDYLIDEADRVCREAGTALENVVRIQQFHTDLRELHATYRAWQRRLPGRALPISAVQVPTGLVVPGCTVQIDLWVYAP